MGIPFGRTYKLLLWNKKAVLKVKEQMADEELTIPPFSSENASRAISDLDIQFSVERTSTFVNNARVSVCGLKYEVIREYMSLFSFLAKDNQFSRIALYAGYIDTDTSKNRVGEIISGDILTFTPSSPPNVWSSMECWTGWSGMLEVKKPKVWRSPKKFDSSGKPILDSKTKMPVGLTLLDVAKIVSKTIFGSYTHDDPKDHALCMHGDGMEEKLAKINVGQFTCWGTEDRIMRTLNSFDNNMKFFRIDDRIHAIDVRDVKSYSTDLTNRDDMLICQANGMIGLPRITNCGMCVDVDVMLDPRFEVFDLVNVQSGFISKYAKTEDEDIKGSYRIMGISHNGHLRGGEWKTTLHLLNNDYYDKSVTGDTKNCYYDAENKAANYGIA